MSNPSTPGSAASRGTPSSNPQSGVAFTPSPNNVPGSGSLPPTPSSHVPLTPQSVNNPLYGQELLRSPRERSMGRPELGHQQTFARRMRKLTPSTPNSQIQSPYSAVGTPNANAAVATPNSLASQSPGARRSHRGGGGGGGGAAGAAAVGTPNSAVDQVGASPLTPMSDVGISVRTEVWGTTVNADQARQAFVHFIDSFCESDSNLPLYPRMIQEALDSGVNNININGANLYAFHHELYHQLVTYPAELIPIFDMVLEDKARQLLPPEVDDMDVPRLQSRPFNLLHKHNMRELNPEDMDTLVCMKGMVIRCGTIVPEMERAFFECSACSHSLQVQIEEGTIQEPTQCEKCMTRFSFKLIHNRCKFTDKQLIKIQETPDNVPDGETPHSVKVFAYDDLVDVAKPGDRVEITGIFKAVPVRTNPRRSALSTVYRTYLDAIHFKKADQRRLQVEFHDTKDSKSEFYTSFEESDVTKGKRQQLEEQIIALSQSPDIYEKLTLSLAPSIWELDDVKKGILCLLFGGSNAEEGAISGRFRGEINVLMCGDPGTSKSQLLQYVHRIAPRGIYTSGKGSSAVGLTASVVKDAETREMTLESGALVLSDRGVCCIDEFDKMSDATRSILHEVMEQQTVSIAKAGIVCTLNARTSILASANPKESRYNPRLSVVENIQIMPTLLTRFDLIYLILDQPHESKDRKLARHLVSLYYSDEDRSADALVKATQVTPITPELLSAYISYARRACRPTLKGQDEAQEQLIKYYTEMRQIGHNAKTVTATPRQLEALIRLSEALAKMRLSPVVSVRDVVEAKRLMDVATQRAATDATTGRIDMDLLTTGVSSRQREQVEQQAEALINFINNMEKRKISVSQLLQDFNNQAQVEAQLSIETLRELISYLETQNVIQVTRSGRNPSMVTRL